MKQEFIWKVGGESGEGIDSTGEIFSSTLNRMGYFVYAFRHFPSRIRGGHTNYKVRVSPRPILAPGDRLDLLIALDQGSIDHNLPEMPAGACIIYDSSTFSAKLPEGVDVRTLALPMTEIAKELGNPIMRNMVGVGASAAYLGLSPESFQPTIADRFGAKSEAVIRSNLEALRRGYDFAVEHGARAESLPLLPRKGQHLLLSGNQALGLGALMGGCRFHVAYPITPATEIMYWTVSHLPQVGGVVMQAEDEIAAINMAIGAGYAGVRAMTTTSGPGFSLMQEALGMAGMTETPVVIVDVQRAGPGTGLPTKHEQGDLNEILYGAHGEIPRIVIAPATVEDCYLAGIEAFNLAERYQCPVIVVSDLVLGLSKASIDGLDYEAARIDRGDLLTDEDLATMEKGSYKRFALTASGVSPRSIPSQANGLFHANSNEHDEVGQTIEDPEMRVAMMTKRLRKLEGLDLGEWALHFEGNPAPDLLLVGYGSTFGALSEACEQLSAEGAKVAHLHLRQLAPFPSERVYRRFADARRVLVVESNATGMLAGVLRREVGFADKLHSLLKFDGDPIGIEEVTLRAKEVL